MNTAPPAFSSWLNAPAHQQWLADEGLRLLAFAKASKLPEGFGNLDEHGQLPADAQAHTMNTARMTHSFAMAHIQGLPGFAELVDHGINALNGLLRDAEFGGWFAAPDHRDGDTGKAAYLHAFVALAASSAVIAQRPGAEALLNDAIAIIEQHFWSEEEGAMRESFNRDWSEEEPYRGANSNMHATEAFLALADVTQDSRWLNRALRIVERVIHRHAASNDHLVVEHFDRDWQPLRDYNQANPADHFRPYGTTPGHGFEWSRLLLHLEAARGQAGMLTPGWLLSDAQQLFANNCLHGWDVDGAPGIVYTLDWDNRPVVRQRLHWVHCEASAAASVLLKRTGEAQYETWYRRFWEFSDRCLIDRIHGSWHHELDPQNRPSTEIWGGKPDLYHAWQAVLIPRLPLAPSMASALAQGSVSVLM
ncbi:AGE family epimerase/isomerase [Pseudomonas sp. FW306-02-F02-AA]|uniref:Sugar isomerase n=1 Tax=Pseudomonas fluorescens TaxID=294 RepID=A0A0N9WB79_PSEFL|nr:MULTISPECIES: AGE family epimerase/isomerase [Pseudomonas]ALI00136.1 sugar isomerase [Pseudomonas fluorescens]PMZ06105.1 AGE family epimerase/isomerase [Pseudomonas sp. FW306-02-F02-AB]PMZ11664.1 AGE family epimerase/isomerase [Pseudomonas sp. FW306-02-H06C]PMZ17587.1 AGE family epimerase/isomerase [Pseudomonas sp. FW306-02-F02-AA]PMZ21837.1 AGE family epimerase/isomerase [Pseudomonas sp. FW306-02-F08-AA]